MCLLLETIKIVDGEIQNLEYHNRRFNSSRRALFSSTVDLDLSSLIRIPEDLGNAIFRCRVLYRHKVESVEFIPHKPRTIKCLKLLTVDDIDYSFKYADRDQLESLYARRGDCDEILIVKGGFITDTSSGNIVFQLSDGAWVTPDTPLLKGTMRMFLLETGQIRETVLRPADLGRFNAARMINCLRGLEEGPPIEMDRILR